MKAKVFIKNAVSNIPYSIGHYFTHIPFSWRLGNEYIYSSREIGRYDSMSADEQSSYIIKKLNDVINHASSSFDFYKNLYSEYGVLGSELKHLDDFKKYPIITKEMIRNHLNDFNGAMKINTGGTSGEPFSFFIDKEAFSREWAHMHSIWSIKGYKKTDIKITLRGRNLGNKNIIYNPVHNEFIINTYKSVKSFKNELLDLFRKYKISYIHGYPSAVYEFFKELEGIVTAEEKYLVTKNIISCFFGSEFPVHYMVDYLQNRWDLDYISWYGHSEMTILACDEEKVNNYAPFMTYGYAEVEGSRLIGTSYNNFDMPLIRYDTGDKVEGKINKNGLLEYFSIKEGREGDFIIDKSGKNIPLTALIFGRHHIMFDIADFIQVGQIESGLVTFYITLKDKTTIDVDSLHQYFDLSNVDINYNFEMLNTPFRSKIGKIKLKV
jgi:phenylacetate-CoA ligase